MYDVFFQICKTDTSAICVADFSGAESNLGLQDVRVSQCTVRAVPSSGLWCHAPVSIGNLLSYVQGSVHLGDGGSCYPTTQYHVLPCNYIQ
jgi:hypothetical protein